MVRKRKRNRSTAQDNMNQNNRRAYRGVPPTTSYGPPASRGGRWPDTLSLRSHQAPHLQHHTPSKDQLTSTPIAETDVYLSKLRALIPSVSVMRKQGYTMQLLTEEELLLKRRCTGCGKTMSQATKKKPVMVRPEIEPSTTKSIPSASHGHPNPDQAKPPPLHCKFHVGQVVNRMWSCCKQPVSAHTPPCGGAPTHIPQLYQPNKLVNLYQYHPTPEPESPLLLSLSGTSKIRSAVALDCEMGTAVSGDSELIRITVIDYFTSDLLLNSFVEPDVPMSNLNTKWSGVTWADIRNAKRDRTCLYGTAAARKELWRFVGQQTVVVGHGASSDLRTLRWIHHAVVDSQAVESARMKKRQEEEEAANKLLKKETRDNGVNQINGGEVNSKPAVLGAPTVPKQKKPKGTGDLALKTLAKKYLGRDIQTKGNQGHDSLEDAIAARDVVHWQVSNLE